MAAAGVLTCSEVRGPVGAGLSVWENVERTMREGLQREDFNILLLLEVALLRLTFSPLIDIVVLHLCEILGGIELQPDLHCPPCEDMPEYTGILTCSTVPAMTFKMESSTPALLVEAVSVGDFSLLRTAL
ncbi:hypothetical protein E2C01_030342 [Portunus trituberculatus]|uniref:Uncharacterized protein n=1 Tax=Portunus trituberculatus TaxID=210409 RepID=A0A5B7ERT6_PORTR|nr:hypothetical protein [Portunus trituberculatus]